MRQVYYHPTETAVISGARVFARFLGAMAFIYAWAFALGIWLVEVEVWVIVWFYYGAFLGARWIYRNNVIEQTISGALRRRDRQKADTAPIDHNGWDTAPTRWRS